MVRISEKATRKMNFIGQRHKLYTFAGTYRHLEILFLVLFLGRC